MRTHSKNAQTLRKLNIVLNNIKEATETPNVHIYVNNIKIPSNSLPINPNYSKYSYSVTISDISFTDRKK